MDRHVIANMGAELGATTTVFPSDRAVLEFLRALVKGPNIASLPELDPLPDHLEATAELKVADNISTDEILPAGAEVLPLRSNIPAISRFTFRQLDPGYADRAAAADGPHLLVAGENYGEGSSREHAVIAPRYLGLRIVIAKSSPASISRTWPTSASCRCGSKTRPTTTASTRATC
jgi:aconitase A